MNHLVHIEDKEHKTFNWERLLHSKQFPICLKILVGHLKPNLGRLEVHSVSNFVCFVIDELSFLLLDKIQQSGKIYF